MRFVVNMSSVAAHPTGLGSYAKRVCDHLVHAYDATVLAPPHVVLPPGTDRLATPATIALGGGETTGLARLARLARRQAFYLRGPVRRGDLVYSPSHHGFLNARDQIVTIHDLISLHHPDNFPRQARFFRTVMPRLVARTRAVFAVSEFTRQEVIDTFEIAAKQVFVVPNIVDASGVTVAAPADKRDYLLIVGCHLPHKNIEEILRVAPLWSARYRLRIVGAAGYYGARIRTLVDEMALGGRVEFLPFVDETRLDQLYREAAALLYPSTIEGFGLPPLEALARGTLSIVSDIPVHREVMGGAARFVRLGDEAEWATAFAAIDRDTCTLAGAPARQAVLDRYAPATVARQLDAALLAVAPGLREHRR